MGGGVRGIVLDESVLLRCDDGEANTCLQPSADYLLPKLRFSGIPTGLSSSSVPPNHEALFLERTAREFSFSYFGASGDDIVHDISVAWGEQGGYVLYVVCASKTKLIHKLSSCSWLTIVAVDEVEASVHNPNMLYINKLERLTMTICHINKKELGRGVLTVGYMMKASRETDFAKRGAFPMMPTNNGLMFMPLTFKLPLSSQLQEVDVVLHKATDEINSVELSESSECTNKVIFTKGMQELKRYMEHNLSCCVVDPISNIYPVLDRLRIQQILSGLTDLNKGDRSTIRPPHFLKVDNFDDSGLAQKLAGANLSLPCIVKPQVACGVPDAHSMAIVFRLEDYKDLRVPLPAVVQEYVDHSSTLFKFYVLGKKVFYAVKKSMPNSDILRKLAESNGLKPLAFDSLKSLPTTKDSLLSGSEVKDQSLDIELVTNAAGWLRRQIGLTIFGFDVVIQESTGVHVIVDVNYLPSFKEVPDDVAIPAFWDAIRKKFDSIQRNVSSTQVYHHITGNTQMVLLDQTRLE